MATYVSGPGVPSAGFDLRLRLFPPVLALLRGLSVGGVSSFVGGFTTNPGEEDCDEGCLGPDNLSFILSDGEDIRVQKKVIQVHGRNHGFKKDKRFLLNFKKPICKVINTSANAHPLSFLCK